MHGVTVPVRLLRISAWTSISFKYLKLAFYVTDNTLLSITQTNRSVSCTEITVVYLENCKNT